MLSYSSKAVGETITAVFDFFSQLPFGEILSAPVVSVSVAQGEDYNPIAILSGVAIISPNSPEMIEQKVTAGMPGVTYLLRCQVQGMGGKVYQQVKYLSILSTQGSLNPAALPVLTGDLPDGVVGAAYSHNLQISGGYAPYTPIGLITGAPTWMGFTVVGSVLVCHGVPNESVPVSYNFSPAVKDSAQNIAVSLQNLSITRVFITGDAPGGTVGQAYSYTYNFGGGTPPYTFTAIDGSLPPSTVMNPATSEIAGNLTLGGFFSWTAKVTDANGVVATQPDGAGILFGEFFIQQLNLSQVLHSSDGGLTWGMVDSGISPGSASVLSGGGGKIHFDAPTTGRVTNDGVVWGNIAGALSGTGFPMWQLWSGSEWLRLSGGGLRVSADGTNYSTRTIPSVGVALQTAWRAVAQRGPFINAVYRASNTNATGWYHSANSGVSWTANPEEFAGQLYHSLVSTNNRFLGFRGASGRVDMSVTGQVPWTTNWGIIPTPTFIVCSAFSPELNRVVVGTDIPGAVHYSDDDGLTWSGPIFMPAVDGLGWDSSARVESIRWAFGKFILVSDGVGAGTRYGVFISPNAEAGTWVNTYVRPHDGNGLYDISIF